MQAELGLMGFVTILLLALAIGLFVSGIFTAYFGRGKSRKVGIGLLLGGIVIGLLVGLGFQQDWATYMEKHSLMWLVWEGVKYVGAFIVGVAIALGIFLAAIMKS